MSEHWSEAELWASVEAYVEMLQLSSTDQPFTKKQYYDELANRFGRTPKAYEYRMQNISYIYSLQGRQWLSGLKPARNVGTNVIDTLTRLIAECERQEVNVDANFEAEVAKLRKNPVTSIPAGNKTPVKTQSTVTTYARDPSVVAWILENAAGYCECCDNPAPFQREDGTPYLEVHHVQRLTDQGADTINNTVALCPNCHRELHYGANKQRLAESLRARYPRLQRG